MSDITTTLQNAYREFCIQAHGLAHGARARLSDQRGQTAAEYMGILLFVAVVIGALIALDVDGDIAKAAKGMVAKIAAGDTTK
jgi:Flp pilus assembly pilin Flp